jgi:protocatechuate 3,4-dioxygenase beta subunit
MFARMDRLAPPLRHRREFLAWLLAAPAVAGCTVASRDDDRSIGGADGSGGGADPSGPPQGDVASVDQEWHAAQCRATSRDLEGPYFERGAPRRIVQIADPSEPGVRLVVEGRLLGPDCRRVLAGYALDVWQADKDGNYYGAGEDGYRLRGKIVADAQGRYRFETILPGRYGDAAGIRPAHLHVKVLTPMGYELLTTQLYFAGDPYLGLADYCTRARSCDSADPQRHLRLADTTLADGRAAKRTTFDYVLART